MGPRGGSIMLPWRVWNTSNKQGQHRDIQNECDLLYFFSRPRHLGQTGTPSRIILCDSGKPALDLGVQSPLGLMMGLICWIGSRSSMAGACQHDRHP